MFNVEGETLYLSLDMDLDDVKAFKEFCETRLQYIEEIGVTGDMDAFHSSTLLQILFSIKKSHPSIKIPLIDSGSHIFGPYGPCHWIRS